jgi:hypothetical protein
LLRVTPLRDFSHAEYLHYEVPGINIPDNVLEQLRAAGADDSRVGAAITAELVVGARPLVNGVVVRAPDATTKELSTFLAQLAVRLDVATGAPAEPR